MENNIEKKKEKLYRKSFFLNFVAIFLRWFYLLAILFSAGYSIYVWREYVQNSDWNDEKKKAYISEQSVLPFDEKLYQKSMDILNNRRSKLENGEKYSGRDIFFPEGF